MGNTVHRPNFFIVGAPKSGTTALYRHLRGHPEIFMSSIKELHFFATDLIEPGFRMAEQDYLAHFHDAGGAKRVGEAGVLYLYSREAAGRIARFDPQAKIIAMLRNPVEMIYSYHAQRLYNGSEDIHEFSAALAAEGDRKRGLRLPRNPRPIETPPALYYYRELALYYEQVLRYIRALGRENIHIIIFDDFKKDLRTVYGQTLDFLGLDSSVEPLQEDSDSVPTTDGDFFGYASGQVRSQTFRNANRRMRSNMLRGFLLRPPQIISAPARLLMPFPLRQALREKLLYFNTEWRPRPELDAALKSRLEAFYAPDVEKLSDLTGRNLTELWNCRRIFPEKAHTSIQC